LAGILSLAALKLGIVNLGSNWGRHFVDAHAVFPILSEISVISIGSAISGGRNSRGIRKCSKTSSRGLISVLALAALKLGIVNLGS
jgi:hypothetical protein